MEKRVLDGYLVWVVLFLIALVGVFAAARVREKKPESDRGSGDEVEA